MLYLYIRLFSYGHRRRAVSVAVAVCLLAASPISLAQLSPDKEDTSIFDGDPVELINEIAGRIQEKETRREKLKAIIKQQGASLSEDETAELAEISEDIDQIQKSLVLTITGKSTLTALYEEPIETTTWQEDIVDILKPLADSVKSITKRPRQISNLRSELESIGEKKRGLTEVISKFEKFKDSSLDNNAANYVDTLFNEWNDELEELESENLIVSRQLDQLLDGDETPIGSIGPKLKSFFLGTGLTLFIAILAAIASYFLMRAAWWLYSTKLVSKDVRRQSPIFRLFSHSYHFITGLVIILSVVLVVYFREDLLLMAISFLLLAGLTFNLKQYLPRYLSEARLLLNLGSVREEERVVYNGLPWQVKSINLHSVLHNPALDGIARLPLSAMGGMVSRPVKNQLWFPTARGDFVILPDGELGQIKYQTPDLVEVMVRGGMALTYTTENFYSLNVINLSSSETFGVSVTFGLDYALQKISVTEIPKELKHAITEKLKERGYEKQLVTLTVELAAANTSSLDYLVFATFENSIASDFYKLERLLLQTCVEVSNERNWTIPFPQLTVHNQ